MNVIATIWLYYYGDSVVMNSGDQLVVMTWMDVILNGLNDAKDYPLT